MANRSAVLAIINPLSGTTSVEQKLLLQHSFMRQADALGFAPEAVLTTHPGHATELAQAAVERGVNRVLAIGGDGTINETAQALVGLPLPWVLSPLVPAMGWHGIWVFAESNESH